MLADQPDKTLSVSQLSTNLHNHSSGSLSSLLSDGVGPMVTTELYHIDRTSNNDSPSGSTDVGFSSTSNDSKRGSISTAVNGEGKYSVGFFKGDDNSTLKNSPRTLFDRRKTPGKTTIYIKLLVVTYKMCHIVYYNTRASKVFPDDALLTTLEKPLRDLDDDMILDSNEEKDTDHSKPLRFLIVVNRNMQFDFICVFGDHFL